MSKMTRINDPTSTRKPAKVTPEASQTRKEFLALMTRAADYASLGSDRFGRPLRRGSKAWDNRYYAALSALHKPLASLPQADRDFRLMVLETQGLA